MATPHIRRAPTLQFERAASVQSGPGEELPRMSSRRRRTSSSPLGGSADSPHAGRSPSDYKRVRLRRSDRHSGYYSTHPVDSPEESTIRRSARTKGPASRYVEEVFSESDEGLASDQTKSESDSEEEIVPRKMQLPGAKAGILQRIQRGPLLPSKLHREPTIKTVPNIPGSLGLHALTGKLLLRTSNDLGREINLHTSTVTLRKVFGLVESQYHDVAPDPITGKMSHKQSTMLLDIPKLEVEVTSELMAQILTMVGVLVRAPTIDEQQECIQEVAKPIAESTEHTNTPHRHEAESIGRVGEPVSDQTSLARTTTQITNVTLTTITTPSDPSASALFRSRAPPPPLMISTPRAELAGSTQSFTQMSSMPNSNAGLPNFNTHAHGFPQGHASMPFNLPIWGQPEFPPVQQAQLPMLQVQQTAQLDPRYQWHMMNAMQQQPGNMFQMWSPPITAQFQTFPGASPPPPLAPQMAGLGNFSPQMNPHMLQQSISSISGPVPGAPAGYAQPPQRGAANTAEGENSTVTELKHGQAELRESDVDSDRSSSAGSETKASLDSNGMSKLLDAIAHAENQTRKGRIPSDARGPKKPATVIELHSGSENSEGEETSQSDEEVQRDNTRVKKLDPEAQAVADKILQGALNGEQDDWVKNLRDIVQPIKQRDGRFKCLVCARTFKFRKHARRHFLSHSSEQPYTCTNCGAKFRRADILRRHTLTRSCTRSV